MLTYLFKRLLYVMPVAFGVSIICFLLVHIAPGDPLNAVLPPDASADMQEEMRRIYGFDKPLPVQFGLWLLKTLHGDLGKSIASGRPVLDEIRDAVGNTLTIAVLATMIGFLFGSFVFATSLISVSMILASGLAFLGLGVKPPEPEWGLMLNTLRSAIYVQPWVAALPGAMIFITSISFNLLSDGLRTAMDIQAIRRTRSIRLPVVASIRVAPMRSPCARRRLRVSMWRARTAISPPA
jgi:ABC-type dipeptide/oligopeptide/nickel transport system permease component